MRKLFLAVGVILGLLLFTSIQSLAQNNLTHACVGERNGHTRIVSDCSECRRWENCIPLRGDSEPPTLNIEAPSEIHILVPDYSITADVDDDSGISHLIFNILPNMNFILTEAPFTITPSYFPPYVGDTIKVYVIALDNFGNSAKDFVTITRVPSPPELLQTSAGTIGGILQWVRVDNRGDNEAMDFYVDFYVTDVPPEPGQIGDLRIFIDSLAGHEHLDLDVSSLSADASIGIYVQVDTDNQIAEFDETNNISFVHFPIM